MHQLGGTWFTFFVQSCRFYAYTLGRLLSHCSRVGWVPRWHLVHLSSNANADRFALSARPNDVSLRWAIPILRGRLYGFDLKMCQQPLPFSHFAAKMWASKESGPEKTRMANLVSTAKVMVVNFHMPVPFWNLGLQIFFKLIHLQNLPFRLPHHNFGLDSLRAHCIR